MVVNLKQIKRNITLIQAMVIDVWNLLLPDVVMAICSAVLKSRLDKLGKTGHHFCKTNK